MFILCSNPIVLKFWSVNDTSIYENFKLKVLIFFVCEIFSYWANDLLGTKVYKTLEFCW